ncbi:hypothetical protein [Nocardia sp. NPDC019395]|uniref:hypothetical protein n=1 Tax=Nocardia sp. NPDC019395 TaxID=3154686 RepID=UPI0033E42B68
MTDIVQADTDALRGLGKDLSGHADVIDELKLEKTVTMPGSPVQAVAVDVGEAALAAFRALSRNIAQMSHAATAGAKSYEELERRFSDHFERLRGELPS